MELIRTEFLTSRDTPAQASSWRNRKASMLDAPFDSSSFFIVHSYTSASTGKRTNAGMPGSATEQHRAQGQVHLPWPADANRLPGPAADLRSRKTLVRAAAAPAGVCVRHVAAACAVRPRHVGSVPSVFDFDVWCPAGFDGAGSARRVSRLCHACGMG